ncbi:MAG: serine/threonine protein kinase [Actinomycetota bacterium]|nr:serine/threonine protein kinase [Actinomycetota bacterium]
MAELDADHKIGAYQVVGRLGGGAMGTVHLALSPGGRLVAVKVARPQLAEDPRFRERFRREIAMARAVGGFWTAAVVDADPDAELPWLATEYVPGPDLHEAIHTAGALPPDSVRGLAAGLAEALAAIHAAGLVHRDLKPSNVLLASDGPRVIDFGISKALEGAGLTATGMLVGTPGYLSPEQIEGREVGPSSDVFAFGAVVVFASSGRNPFGEGDTAALLYRAVHTKPDLRNVPHDLREVVSRCLERTPSARPTAPELVTTLGGRATGDWLPTSVRTMVDQRQTEMIAARPPTKVMPQGGPLTRVRWWLERDDRRESTDDRPGRRERKAATRTPAQETPPAPPADTGRSAAPDHAAEGGRSAATGRAAETGYSSASDHSAGGDHPGERRQPAARSHTASGRAIAQPSILARCVNKVLGWGHRTPEPPPPRPEPVEQLADRVNQLVEQARAAMGETLKKREAMGDKPKKRDATGEKPKKALAKVERPPLLERRGGNQAVFSTARGPRVIAAGAGAGGAFLLAAAAVEASRSGQVGIGGAILVLAGFLALVALLRLAQAIRPQRRIEVTAAALAWRRGSNVTTLTWSKVARVRIVEDRNQPWLVVWPRDPSALPGKSDHHGGYRVYPIAHEQRATTRDREVRELRAALAWYGRSAYDPSA